MPAVLLLHTTHHFFPTGGQIQKNALVAFSAVPLLVGWQDGHPACKKWGDGGGHWLVRIERRPAGWSVCLPLLIFHCTIKSRSSLLAPAHPGGPGKRAVKWWWCGAGQILITNTHRRTARLSWPGWQVEYHVIHKCIMH